jgi:hypothetical protein
LNDEGDDYGAGFRIMVRSKTRMTWTSNCWSQFAVSCRYTRFVMSVILGYFREPGIHLLVIDCSSVTFPCCDRLSRSIWVGRFSGSEETMIGGGHASRGFWQPALATRPRH